MNLGLRIVLGDVLAKHGLELRGRAHECLAVEVAGVLARAAVPLPRWVCAIGEDRTSPVGREGNGLLNIDKMQRC